MGKDHTNIQANKPYEFLGGMCAEEYKGKSYKAALEADAPKLDMGKAPYVKGGSSGKKEKETY